MKTLYTFLSGTLRGRLIVGVAVVHAVMMALFIGDLTTRQRAMLLESQIEEATGFSHTLAISAAGWLAAADIAGLQELVEAQRRYPEIIFAMLADKQGRILADTDNTRQGLYLLDLPKEARQKLISRTPALVDMVVPAMIGERHVGWARIGIGQKGASNRLSEITRDGFFYALAAVFIGSVVAWFMGRRITGRLYAIQETIGKVRAGDRLARSQMTGVDEASVLAREFNTMLDTLAERGMLAELSAEIGSALTMPGDLREVLDVCAAALVSHLDVAFARIWTLDATGTTLELQASAGMYTNIDGSHNRIPVGKFKIGLIASERKPHITNSVMGDPRVHDQEWAKREGMVAFAGHPLTIDDKLVGVMAMFSRKPLTEVTLMALAAVSNEIALGIERKCAEETLNRLNRELQAVSNCNQVLVRAEDEQTLLGDICRIICDQAGYRLAWIGYAEHDEAKTIRPVAWAGFDDEYVKNARLSWADDSERGQGPGGTAIRTGEIIYIQNLATDPHMEPWRDSALQRGYHSIIALPLNDEKKDTLGALIIYSAESNAFTPDEIRLLKELSGDLAFGITVLRTRIERKQREDAHELNSQRMEALLQLNQMAEVSLKEITDFALQEAVRLTQSTIGYLAFLNENESVLTMHSWSKSAMAECAIIDKPIVYPIETTGLWGEAVRQRQPVITNDYAADNPLKKGCPEGHVYIRSHMNIPVFDGSRIVIVAGVGNKKEGYDQSDVRQLTLIMEGMWQLIERKRAEEALHLQAVELEEEVAERQMAQESLQEKAFLLEEEIEKRQQMQEELEQLNENLELHVQERTAELASKNVELEKMNRLFIGRELRMVELKEKIKKLEAAT